jgi:hypothetical protein
LSPAAHGIGLLLQQRPDNNKAIGSAGRGVASDVPHGLAGNYLMLPGLGFRSAFVVTVLLVTLYLFTPMHRTPFIYFQF